MNTSIRPPSPRGASDAAAGPGSVPRALLGAGRAGGRAAAASAFSAVLAAVLLAAGPATAATFRLEGGVQTTGAPDSSNATDTRSGPQITLALPTLQDQKLNIAYSRGTLSNPDGTATVNTHACSGGSPAFGGAASATMTAVQGESYRITSDTLPDGTRVPVTFNFGISGRLTATESGDNFDFSSASARGQGQILLNSTTDGPLVNRQGIADAFSGTSMIQRFGDLNVQSDEGSLTFSLPVGSVVLPGVIITTISQSSSGNVVGVDGDGQLAVRWGLGVGDGAVLVNLDDPTRPPPGLTGANADGAASILPDRPPTVTLTPEPGGPVALALAVVASLPRRRRRQRLR